MSNSVLLSAMTMIALTGITLTSLKYRHDSVEFDDDDTIDATSINPKFNYYEVLGKDRSTEKIVAKRSIDEPIQYSIDDPIRSLVDEARREKVKEVHTIAVRAPLR